MTLTDFYTRVNYTLRGTDDDAPAHGDEEAQYWLDTLNRKKDELYQDVTKNWSNTYEVRSIGTVAASATPSYSLPTDFLALSGDNSRSQGESTGVYIITTDDKRINIGVVPPEQRSPYYRTAFVAGFNPQKVYITTEITADEDIVGGTIYAPGYYMPDDVANEADVLPFLDPNWAVMAVASEIAFNDITYEDKAPDLNAKANNLYAQMVKRNRGVTYNNPRSVPTNVNRIRDTRYGG